VKAIGRFVRENLNVARHYGDWLVEGDAANAEQIEKGEGAVVRMGPEKDRHITSTNAARGTHVSAKCPHLGASACCLEPRRKVVGLSMSRLSLRRLRARLVGSRG
jgi:hypothetical protein